MFPARFLETPEVQVKIISVTSASKKLGKTMVICGLAKRFRKMGCTVSAMKLRPLGSVSVRCLEGRGRKGSDTWRFSEAGASYTALVDFQNTEALTGFIHSRLPECDILLAEGGTAAGVIMPDLLIYISGDVPDPGHADLEESAQIRFRGPPDEQRIASIADLVPVLLFPDTPSPFSIGFKHWVSLCGTPVTGEGVASILRAVKACGSLNAAARSTGIPYRRVWVLLSEAEERLGARLVFRCKGGVGGGGSSLTPLAEMLLQEWEETGPRIAEFLKEWNL